MMKMKYTLATLAATTLAANAAIIAQYDASEGNPLNAGEVLAPSSSVFDPQDTTLGATDVQEGAFEGGQAAWRNLDGTDNNNPGYIHALSGASYQAMFDNGFTLTARFRLQQGGHFLYVGGDGGNTAGGYAFAGDRRVGISLGVGTDADTYKVTPVGVGTAAVDNIPTATYVRVVITGDAGAETGTWQMYNDDTDALISDQSFTAWANGNTSTDAHTGFQSGSSGGDDREMYIREFTLETVPEPSSTALLGLGGLALILRRRK